MISIRVFELSAGPRTAKVVPVDGNGSISSELQKLSAAVGEFITLSNVSFHTLNGKKIDRTPLPTDRLFTEMGITHGSYIICRKKGSGSGVAKNKGATKDVQAATAQAILTDPASNPPAMLSPTSEINVVNSDTKGVLDGEAKLATAVDSIIDTEPPGALKEKLICNDVVLHSSVNEVDKQRSDMDLLPRSNKTDSMNDQMVLERERLLEVQDIITRRPEQQSAIEKNTNDIVALKSIQHFNEKPSEESTVVRQEMHANVQESDVAITTLQERVKESVQALVSKEEENGNLSTNTNIELNAVSNIGVPVHLLPAEKELIIHERLLHHLFSIMGSTAISASDLVYRFRSNIGDLYTAISVKYNLRRGMMHESVYGYLQTHLPQLAPATPVICFLHDGHEVEYLELIALDLLGLTLRSPLTWLDVRLSGSHKTSLYYFSSLVGLSQRERPKWLENPKVEIGVCRISEFCSICPRLALRNPEWTNNGAPYSQLLRSKAAALILSRRPELQGSVEVVLNSYIGREETLLKDLCVRQ